ncbi:histidine kinase [Okibacterium endophyticum]
METASNVTIEPAWHGLGRRLSPFAVSRSPGEWGSDTVFFALALVQWWVNGLPEIHPQIADWFWPIDRTVGFLACCLLWWTRRYPVVCALLFILPGSIAITAGLPTLIGVCRVGLLAARPATALLITAVHIVCALPYHLVAPIPAMPWEMWVVVIPLLYALALCIGLLGRARRQVIAGLRESAARDRERYEEQLISTRRDERERIAREMHDVLAHRISLLSVHAGALEFRAGSTAALTPDEVQAAARVIRENAHLAVEDLRELLALLRADGDELGTGRPQPRLADIGGLAAEAAAAGQQVDLSIDVDAAGVRESVQRTIYRVVQESLTNARKHAPLARVRAQVTENDSSIRVLIDNAVPVGVSDTDLPAGGSGLIGLAERVRVDGGTLVSGIEGGRFRVIVDLPAGTR